MKSQASLWGKVESEAQLRERTEGEAATADIQTALEGDPWAYPVDDTTPIAFGFHNAGKPKARQVMRHSLLGETGGLAYLGDVQAVTEKSPYDENTIAVRQGFEDLCAIGHARAQRVLGQHSVTAVAVLTRLARLPCSHCHPSKPTSIAANLSHIPYNTRLHAQWESCHLVARRRGGDVQVSSSFPGGRFPRASSRT